MKWAWISWQDITDAEATDHGLQEAAAVVAMCPSESVLLSSGAKLIWRAPQGWSVNGYAWDGSDITSVFPRAVLLDDGDGPCVTETYNVMNACPSMGGD